jgi:hypothetical protein
MLESCGVLADLVRLDDTNPARSTFVFNAIVLRSKVTIVLF